MAETPFRISERYSSQDLTRDNPPSNHDRKRKRSATPSHEMYRPKVADRPRLSTPDPRTPGLPSSAITPGLTTDGSSVATAHTVATVLTIPDDNDKDDGIVRGVAIINPFAGSPGYVGGMLKEFNDSSLVSHELGTGRNEAFEVEVLDSVELSYAQTASSQEDTGCDEPSRKRRRIDAQPVSEQVLTVEIPDRISKAAEHEVMQGTNQNDSKAVSSRSGEDVEEDATEDKEETDLEDSPSQRDKEAPTQDDDNPGYDDDPDYETNSNWDHLEAVQDRLKEYNTFKKSIKGYEKWTPAQTKLHKLLALRGCWPMFEHSWALNFSIRNIYPTVFAPAKTRKRVAIYSRTNEFRTTRALEAIFDLSALICSYRQSGIEEKIGGVLKKALKRYIGWAAYDAGVEDRVYVPTLQVHEFDPRKWAGKVKASRAAAAEMMIKEEPTSEWDLDGEEVDSDPISDEVEKRLRRLAARHRESLVTPESRHLPEYMWTYREQPPLLFAFVIVQHMVMVVSLDPSRPDNEIIVFSELDMSLADQWLWNALAIALPVHMARDALWDRREQLPVAERIEVDDPDL